MAEYYHVLSSTLKTFFQGILPLIEKAEEKKKKLLNDENVMASALCACVSIHAMSALYFNDASGHNGAIVLP